MKLDRIRECLGTHQAALIDGSGCMRAAVAVVLREAEAGAEFVAIRRSERAGDPWSGHMALPGGRQHPSDMDLFTTVARETREEIGVDLTSHAQLLGRLDEFPALAGGRSANLVITPFVFALKVPVEFVLNRDEVERALWVPLTSLREAQDTIRFSINGQDFEQQACIYQGHTIWGLTYRILARLVELL